MKVHIQKRIKPLIAVLMAITIFTTATVTNNIKAEASIFALNPTSSLNASRLYDIALTKTGVVANQGIIDNVINQTINTLDGTAKSYWDWCESNGKAINANTWQEYLDSDAYSTLGFRLSRWALVSADFLSYLMDGESLRDKLEEMLPTAITGSEGKDITLTDEVVDDIRNEFDVYIQGNNDYYYINSLSPDNLNPLWFPDVATYEHFKSYAKTITNLQFWNLYGTNRNSQFTTESNNAYVSNAIYIYVLDESIGYVTNTNTAGSKYNYYLDALDSQWQYNPSVYYKLYSYPEMPNNEEEVILANTLQGAPVMRSVIGKISDNYEAPVGFVSSDGRPVRVFKTLNALKMFSVGMQPYYITNGSMDFSNTDNSVKVNGDYLNSGSYTYSHDVIQNQIDNSENITNETVNNIVNEGASTIINNHYYGSSDSGGSGDGDDGNDGGFGDGILDLIGGIGELLDFILSLVGEVISILAGFLNALLDILKSIGGIFSGFSGLLGELFGFIPTELITLLTASVEAVIIIAVWKMIRK